MTSTSVKILLLQDDLSKPLRSCLDEVSTLWNSDLVVKERGGADGSEQGLQSSLTKRLIVVCERLLEARTRLSNEEFDEIVELHSSNYFNFNVEIKGPLATHALVSTIIRQVNEEILILVAEARNVKSEKLLLKAFTVRIVS